MPEGDTIRRDAARLGPLLLGRAVRAAASRWPAVVRELAGATVTAVEPLGKNLLVSLDDGTTLRIHRGMTGTWAWFPAGEPVRVPMARTSLRLELDAGTLVAVQAPTVERFRTRERPLHPTLSALGPDVLAEDFQPEVAAERAAAAEGPTVAEVLLDQRVACGIGNVYRSEILFVRRQDPFAAPGQLDPARWTALYQEAVRLMRANLGPGQRNTTGQPWPHHVYGRAGRPCPRCRTRIEARDLGRDLPRRLWWCPACQRRID